MTAPFMIRWWRCATARSIEGQAMRLKDKVAVIVRQQIDRMVASFALIYFRVRNEL